MISVVQPSRIDAIWPKVEPLLRKAENYASGEMTAEDIYPLVKDGRMHLSIAVVGDEIKGAYVTDVCTYPRYKTLRVLWGGGEKGRMDEYLDELIAHLKAGAMAIGAQGIEVYGRRGWIKALHKYGFEEASTVLKMVV